MHDCQFEDVLVVTTCTLNGFVQAVSLYHAIVNSSDVIGVFLHKGFGSLCRNASTCDGHTEHTFEHCKKNGLLHFKFVITNLCSNIVHEVYTRSDCLAEGLFSPTIHTACSHKTLLISSSCSGSDVSCTVVVLGSRTANSTEVGNTDVQRTSLTTKGGLCLIICADCTTFCQFGLCGVGNSLDIRTKSLWIECLRIKICHNNSPFNLSFSRFLYQDLQPCMLPVRNRSSWKCQPCHQGFPFQFPQFSHPSPWVQKQCQKGTWNPLP